MASYVRVPRQWPPAVLLLHIDPGELSIPWFAVRRTLRGRRPLRSKLYSQELPGRACCRALNRKLCAFLLATPPDGPDRVPAAAGHRCGDVGQSPGSHQKCGSWILKQQASVDGRQLLEEWSNRSDQIEHRSFCRIEQV